MRAFLLTLGSVALTFLVLGNAYYQKKQFYPSVVYITKSNPSMAVIYLQAFVVVLLVGKLMRKMFFGQLRAAEMEHLIERSWYAVTETCLAFTVFRDDFSPKFVALFTLLLFLKCFHWLAEDRVDYMERSPVISFLFHVRVVSLLLVLAALDYLFVSHAYHSTLTRGASVQLVFGFEYAILFSVVCNIVLKYNLHAIDLHSENPWDNKAVYLLYTELVMGFVKVVLYLTFMTIMIKIHTFPLFAIRPMYLSMRSFKKALNDVIMSQRAIRNMNTMYPDATPEELAAADNVCIICREEMTGGSGSKKLPCNHIFHASCLRSWFQRQQTCPTCRMDVLRASNQTPASQNAASRGAGTPAQGPQNQPQEQPQQQIPPWQGFGAGGGLPPGFPFWFPQPPRGASGPSQQPQSSQGNQTQSSQPNLSSPGTSSSSSSSTQPPFFMPPFPFMPFILPPPPMPPADFSGLTREELEAMEGQERENLESRIQCLRNIQILLDAAVLQMQQYSVIVASLRQSTSSSASRAASETTAQPDTSESRSQPVDRDSQSKETSQSSSSLADGEPSSSITDQFDPNSTLRERRLHWLAQKSTTDNQEPRPRD